MFTKVLVEEKHENLNAFSVYPGVVDTNMQQKIRKANPQFFPLLKFVSYKQENQLEKSRHSLQKNSLHYTKCT